MTVSTTIITMVDGVRIAVPDSLNLITPYVLREQQDWFEDEIKFLRRYLQPKQRVIDIGANHGVYTLSMAQTVGSSGHVWAFEPASTTAQFLAQGIAANAFSQVTLEQCALSSSKGQAQLSLNENSELNALVQNVQSGGASETVSLVTLDDCMQTHAWRDIEFLKIDAEGEEANILKGGARFFAEMSPLVQYEVRAGAVVHMELVQAFTSIGYASYRLVPGLDVLVPFDIASRPDSFLLNLFCCKPDQAARLSERGLLVNSVDLTVGQAKANQLKMIGSGDEHDWRLSVAQLPYGIQLAQRWEQTMAPGHDENVNQALFYYAISQDSSLSSVERVCALEASFRGFEQLCEHQPSHLRLASLARAARDFGARSVAINALAKLCDAILKTKQVDPSEPFLAPCERFDSIPLGPAIGNWVLAAALEELERIGSFSSFYTGTSARQRLEMIHSLGFGSSEMQRRLDLLKQRFA